MSASSLPASAPPVHHSILSALSHELMNPLNLVVLNASILEHYASSLPAPDALAIRDIAAGLARASERMRCLVADLLDLSRIESGLLPLALVPVPGERFASELDSRFAKLARDKGIELDLELPAELLVECDPERTLRVFSQLLGNALKFTGAGGRVHVRGACTQGKRAVFEVQDTGPGIPSEEQTRLFERFWQGKKPHQSGKGMGLALCKGIVEAQGGKIWVTSAEGTGSTFHFTLPAAHC